MSNDIVEMIDADLQVEPEPFKSMADKLGTTEEELILAIMAGIDTGQIKRFGAIVNHVQAGYKENTMLAWALPDDKIAIAGTVLADEQSVSHCFERMTTKDWPYNLYAMVHAKSLSELNEIKMKLHNKINEISPENEFVSLKSIKEYKKSSFSLPSP